MIRLFYELGFCSLFQHLSALRSLSFNACLTFFFSSLASFRSPSNVVRLLSLLVGDPLKAPHFRQSPRLLQLAFTFSFRFFFLDAPLVQLLSAFKFYAHS
ncbi:MAG: hypothetical protein K0S56_81 [Microvirga sp.]|nr:hypothetical protein [Microvirga sp.]